MVRQQEVMRLLIAYDGSGYSHNALQDLRWAGLPEKADVLMVSVAEVWLSPLADQTRDDDFSDEDIREYFQKHSEQIDRNVTQTEQILIDAKAELQNKFPKWAIETESIAGSPSQVILQKTTDFVPDLVVVGPRGLSSDRGTGLGSVSQTVLSYSRFPVRIGRGSFGTGVDQLKIAICFDGSACSLDAVKAAAARDWQKNAEFTLFVVTDPFIELIPGRAFQVIPGLSEYRMTGEIRWVKTLADEAIGILENSGLTTSVQIYSGNPRIMLANGSTEWKADTVFVGMNSRRSNLLGCVASAVAARSPCSVEVIPRSNDR